MEIIFYILWLIICEIVVYSLMIVADYYFKSKNFKIIKRSKIMIKSKYGNNQELSKIIYWLQVFNYIYIIAYLSIAVIDTFFYRSSVLFNIDFYSVIIYFGLAMILLIVISLLSPLRDKK